ncbi:SusD/RagB family nutrient-binding outer membrane lipoprotein [Emticicia sp. C21]|uniref:SusD/RagB family nutrient-binding outer membrane lipoprotein n=1 Tax=Emticicia sp. C21 TaxID=2302915 RepID=UPI000E3408E8|nr:SusD/RagB family nutrient-binding outer membrane lipoprotein [Emticicia sp. C21]RFS18120.1 SusD/RagB family nutrient-binding outer membrane lipoprotein [Emticicia sp. C21]
MKKIYSYLLISFFIVLASSCDKGFDELNINKTAATAINPVFTFNNALINASFPAGIVQYEMGIVQQMVTPNSGVVAGANFNQDNRDATQQTWQRYYRTVVLYTTDVIKTVKDVPARSNLLNMARIWKAYAFTILTDTYGDVPYAQAGKGFTDQIVLPKYDTQQAIYTDIIKELTEASAALDAAKTRETADILYGGDIAKWKKLGYSLLLRVGMRLSKVDANLAKETVQKAIQGGVFSSNADNAFIKHDANYVNGVGQMLNSTEAANFFLAAPFVDYLKKTNDPRLKAIAVRYVGAGSGSDQVASRASTDPAIQIGMPLGYDNNTVKAPAAAAGLASFYEYSQVDRTRMTKVASPMFLVTYAQTQLLLAEAVQRGWATGSIEDYYKNGVRAHMEQLAAYDANSTIATEAIDTYLKNNPFDTANALEQINTQYWVASFLNGPEAFANFRRSGFPKLMPNPFPGKSIKGEFIRRLTYPNSEISVNSVNVKEAIGRQGNDDLDSRVWWDK